MDATELSTKLQSLPPENYTAILSLVRANKDIFDREGLKPNAVDCLDRAVAQASPMHNIEDRKDEAYVRLFASYAPFHSVAEAWERHYWRKAEKDFSGISHSHNRVVLSLLTETELGRDIDELKTIRKIFDVYARALLTQHRMEEYIPRLLIP